MDAPVNLEGGGNVQTRGGEGEVKQGFWATWKKRIILWALILGIFLVVCWSLVIYDAVMIAEGRYVDLLYLYP